MTVRETIEALIGVDPSAEVEICDANGRSASLLRIDVKLSHGGTYVEAITDGLIEEVPS